MPPPCGQPAWPALAAARLQRVPRVDLHVDGRRVGSVDRAHVASLARWPHWILQDPAGLHFVVPSSQRDVALSEINEALRGMGLIRAWRDEAFPLLDPRDGRMLATAERASMRFWGALTRGAHCNGYVADASGRPAFLWIARRSAHKPTDPGLLDNLVGGGVPHGQSPLEAVVREGWEEAGLEPWQMRALQAGSVIRVDCDVPEGRMVEDLHVFDLELHEGLQPRNQDGEVSELRRMTIAEAAECAACGLMTVDASLVTLDFLLRHRLLADDQHAQLASQLARLRAATDA